MHQLHLANVRNGHCYCACMHRATGKQSDLQIYGTSKLYNILAAKEIQKRIGDPKGARSLVAHLR